MTTRNRIRPARFSRRSLLQGLGAGAALFAPFLRYRSVMAQSASATPAGNLLIFYTPNGHLRSLAANGATTIQFDATGSASSLTLGPSLAPLQPFVSDVAITKGLCNKTPTFIESHQDICRILTCVAAPKEGNDNSQFTGYGPSIDQSVGMAIGQTPLVVAVDPYRDQPQWRTFLSWRSSGVNEPFTKNHQSAFTDLFGNLTGQTTSAAQMAAIMRAQARNQSLLDFVKGDIATFRSRINSNDKAHMDAYLDAIQTVEQKVTTMSSAPGTCNTASLQTSISALPATAPVQNDDKSSPGVVDQMQARGQVWMDMIAAAFACGSRRVAVIQWQGASEGYDVGANTGSPDHHSVSHYSFGAASANRWIAIDQWYATQFAYQLNALKTLGVLDKTVVVWVSEITQGHNQLNMVVPVAGGQALGMKMGQYLQFPFKGNEVEGSGAIPVGQDPANTGFNDLWATVQQAVGVQKTTFGDAKWNTGPLPGLWSAI
jgi:Protein of unknown function (DUF1552)